MMDCQKIKQLLPLWIGQDLPDSVSTTEVSRHLKQCADCDQHRQNLQASLDALQGSSAETLSEQAIPRSVWPSLAMQISNWDKERGRERFNGWIPASVMALAVALMIAVSLPSIRDEFFSGHDPLTNTADLFQVTPVFQQYENSQPNDEANGNRTQDNTRVPQRRPFGTPVIYYNPNNDPIDF